MSKTAEDRIWDDIRSTLARTAMKNMTIPQAKVFSAEATEYIGPHVRKLVNIELAAHHTALEVAKREARIDEAETAYRLVEEYRVDTKHFSDRDHALTCLSAGMLGRKFYWKDQAATAHQPKESDL